MRRRFPRHGQRFVGSGQNCLFTGPRRPSYTTWLDRTHSNLPRPAEHRHRGFSRSRFQLIPTIESPRARAPSMKSLPRAAGYLCCSLCIGLVFEQFAPPALADLWGLSPPANGAPASGTENNYNKVFRFDEQGNKLANDIPAGSAGLSFP